MGKIRRNDCPTSYYYLTLGLNRNASEEEIKDRYRELAKIYHPDVNRSPEAEEKFKEINEAYDYLTSHLTLTKERNINNEILKGILKVVRKDIHKNLQKVIKRRNRIIQTAVVNEIKKELKKR